MRNERWDLFVVGVIFILFLFKYLRSSVTVCGMRNKRWNLFVVGVVFKLFLFKILTLSGIVCVRYVYF